MKEKSEQQKLGSSQENKETKKKDIYIYLKAETRLKT